MPFNCNEVCPARARLCNLYEALAYADSTGARREGLYPVLWSSDNGAVLVMRAAEPIPEEEFDMHFPTGSMWRERLGHLNTTRPRTGADQKADLSPSIIPLLLNSMTKLQRRGARLNTTRQAAAPGGGLHCAEHSKMRCTFPGGTKTRGPGVCLKE